MATTTTSKLVRQVATYLRNLSRRRKHGIVTADDVNNFFTRRNVPASVNTRLSVTRQVLRRPEFIDIMTVKSTRPEAKGRRITGWLAK